MWRDEEFRADGGRAPGSIEETRRAMDIASLIGMLIGASALGYVFFEVSHGHLSMFFSLEGVLMVGCGSVSVIFMSMPLDRVLSIPGYVKRFMFHKGMPPAELIKLTAQLAEKARRDGILALEGEVNNPVRLDYAILRQLPTVELAKTLECVSNLTDKCELVPFGCELIGTALWKGVRLVDVLDLAGGLKSGVVAVSLIGEDEFVSSIPPEAALDPATIVAYEMNGQVLPYEHGYPARILVPGRYGFKSPKWIRVIRPSSRPVVDWYGQRNWSKDGYVRTMTRIDLPAPSATVPPGSQRVAGIAYAANRGISKVEYSADGGQSWATATLLEAQPGPDAWVRWEGSFQVGAGQTVQLVSRATDGQGALQQEAFSLAQPDGGAGWHHISVTGA